MPFVPSIIFNAIHFFFEMFNPGMYPFYFSAMKESIWGSITIWMYYLRIEHFCRGTTQMFASDMDVLFEDRALLPRYNPDVFKWHLFISNLTEDVFQVLKDTFFLDYWRTLRFQSLPGDSELVTEQPVTISVPESDGVLKGSLLYFLLIILTYQSFIHFFSLFSWKVLIKNYLFAQRV